ncbi:phosphotransferase family protein [Streptomyces sp. NPDC059853]|uniref:phosphotransferase family protein n=1 Tax=Streptomyces sp. NPDC059853 TaxID=3346973 RepID=UPI003655D9CA
MEDLDRAQLSELLAAQFGSACGNLEFSPLGEDSWQYRAGELWVSVRRDLRGHVPAAYQAAYEMHCGGLDFVLAPLAGRDGRTVHKVGCYPVVVFPYLQVTQVAMSTPGPEEKGRIVSLVDRVHRAVPAAEIPEETYTLPFEEDLERALHFAERTRDAGPYARKFAELFRLHREYITSLRREAAELGAICRAEGGTPVLTHGEPSAPNILCHGDELLLADWGGARWGPPERDWYHVMRTLDERVVTRCRPSWLRFYHVRWVLSEIAEYASVFSREHTGSADDHAMWRRLTNYLPVPQPSASSPEGP